MKKQGFGVSTFSSDLTFDECLKLDWDISHKIPPIDCNMHATANIDLYYIQSITPGYKSRVSQTKIDYRTTQNNLYSEV